jgi:mRNA interferase MazF
MDRIDHTGGTSRMDRSLLRGEMYYADLTPVVGSEQGGCRPVVILQNDLGNGHSPTTIVAAITSRSTKASLPTHCVLSRQAGPVRGSVVLLEQVRTIDKSRLKGRIGVLGRADMQAIDHALAISVGLDGPKGVGCYE